MATNFALPDLRFEQSFVRSLQSYAGTNEELTDKELLQVDDAVDLPSKPPLNPVTPSIVLYAILKDQIIMPLVQGFIWAGILLSWRPIRVAIIGAGQRSGQYLFNMIGLSGIRPYR